MAGKDEPKPAAKPAAAAPADSTPGGLARKAVGEPKDDLSDEEQAARAAKFDEAYLKARRGY